MQDMKQQSKEESKKERHIVTWTQEEDDILREQIGIHGTVNWAIIASKFKDKTTRQCKRRWYTYLNSDFKKGGWSPEEDKLLCEAQKLFGNRWTEIAKVVSGRTDNAVKNRFSTLCRKREKHAALAKENISYINANKEKIMLQQAYINTDATSESAVPIKKKRRAYIPNEAEKINYGDRSHIKNGTPIDQKARAPLALLAQNSNDVNLPAQDNKGQGAFLKKDDPKISVLMQQSQLRSLALNVDKENMDRSSENACEVPQEFWNRTKESDILSQKIPDLKLEDLKHTGDDLKDSNEGGQSCRRKLDLYKDSPGSSQYSTGSTLLPQGGGDNLEMKLTQVGDEKGVSSSEEGFISSPNVDQDVLTYCEEQINSDGIVSSSSGVEFSSPVQVTSLFRSLAAGIPSPQFSESERNFLWKTLGIKSPSTSAKPSLPCKRSLLHSL